MVIATDQGVETKTVAMPSDRARVDVSFDLKGRPQRVEVDPQFAVYRRLSPFETPPALSKAFGAKKTLIVMSADSAPLYAGLAKAWREEGQGVETVLDSQIDALPADRAVWVFGAGNKFMPVVAQGLKAYGLRSTPADCAPPMRRMLVRGRASSPACAIPITRMR